MISIGKLSLLPAMLSLLSASACAADDGAADRRQPEAIELVIVATETSADNIVAKKESLEDQFKALDYVYSSGCSNLKPDLFLLAAYSGSDDDAARKHLEQARQVVPDAYQRHCAVVDGSLLALGLPVIDRSIESVPADAVNWGAEDRVSELVPLGQSAYLYVRRRFVDSDTDGTEGRRQTLEFISPAENTRAVVRDHCWDFGQPVLKQDKLVLQCTTGRAANHFVHESIVYDIDKQAVVATEDYCRNPRLVDSSRMECDKEAVNADGELKLSEKRVPIRP